MTGTPELPSPWPGHRALAATCLLTVRVSELTGGGMGPRWAGLEGRMRPDLREQEEEGRVRPLSHTLVLPFLPSRLRQGLKKFQGRWVIQANT